MTPDLSPFVNAVTRLEEGLDRYQRDTEDLQIRDALIQRFKFTYEIAHKMLKRTFELLHCCPEELEPLPEGGMMGT